MVGLDGFIFLRFIRLCFKYVDVSGYCLPRVTYVLSRISCFFSFWGVLILIPIYASAHGDLTGWGALTLANVIHQNHALRLWWPAIFSYIFSLYVCRLLYQEYQLFVHKRLEYLIRGDPDTPPQTYYTLMVENIPSEYRSVPALQEFFDTLFPGADQHGTCSHARSLPVAYALSCIAGMTFVSSCVCAESVYSVSAVLKLQRLEAMCATRQKVRPRIVTACALLIISMLRSLV